MPCTKIKRKKKSLKSSSCFYSQRFRARYYVGFYFPTHSLLLVSNNMIVWKRSKHVLYFLNDSLWMGEILCCIWQKKINSPPVLTHHSLIQATNPPIQKTLEVITVIQFFCSIKCIIAFNYNFICWTLQALYLIVI